MHLELFSHQGDPVSLLQAKALVELESKHDGSFGDRVKKRFLGVLVHEGHLASHSNQDDRALLLRPGELLGETWQEVVYRDDLRVGETHDVLFRHILRGEVFGVEISEVLVLRQDEDIDPQILHRFPGLVLMLSGQLSELPAIFIQAFAFLQALRRWPIRR